MGDQKDEEEKWELDTNDEDVVLFSPSTTCGINVDCQPILTKYLSYTGGVKPGSIRVPSRICTLEPGAIFRNISDGKVYQYLPDGYESDRADFEDEESFTKWAEFIEETERKKKQMFS